MSKSFSNQSVKNGRLSMSANASRRASVSSSIRKAYGEVKKKGLYHAIPTRFVVVFVAAIANTLSYTMRTNMSVTIVAMVTHKSSNSSDSCFEPVGTVDDTVGEFDWDETLQGHILGSFYYGYIATNINGGQLADKFGPRYLCGFVIFLSAIMTLLTPVVARWNEFAMIVLRIATGLAQGVLTPAIYSLMACWIPRHERGLMLALIQVGGNMGAVISNIFSGYLSEHGFAGGWPSVFYVFGIIGILIFVLWMMTIYNKPTEHPRIADDELSMILGTTGVSMSKSTKKDVPWLKIFTSLPVWAISVAKFCGAWGNLMLMSKLPSYLKSMLHVTIQENGFITSAVYIMLSISLTGFGFFSDWICKKQLLSDTLTRKVFETIALVGPAICLLLVPLWPCEKVVLIGLLLVAMVIFGLNAGGDKPIVVELAPDHSGTIYGITNAIASLPGIIAPLAVGELIDQYGNREGWKWVFYSSAGIYIFGMVFFLLFATASPQPWGVLPSRSRRPTVASTRAASRAQSRAVSRVQSRAVSRAVSRKATFVDTADQLERKATLRAKMDTPRLERRLEEKLDDEDDVYTIDIDKAINKMRKELGDRIESDLKQDTTNVEEYFDEDGEEYVDYEEEEAERLQYFKERRFSIFPIA